MRQLQLAITPPPGWEGSVARDRDDLFSKKQYFIYYETDHGHGGQSDKRSHLRQIREDSGIDTYEKAKAYALGKYEDSASFIRIIEVNRTEVIKQ